MKTILINTASPINYPPIGSLYLVDALKKEGIDTTLVDSTISSDELERIIDETKTDSVNMSVITSPQIDNFVHLSERIKEKHPNINVLWGGIHPTINSEQCISEDYIDHVVIGNAEESLPNTLIDLHDRRDVPDVIKSIHKRSLDDFSPNWDSVMPISRFLFPEEHFLHSKSKTKDKKNIFYYLNTSRGCMYSCSFCTIPTGKWKSHSSEWVKNQVEEINGRLKFNGGKMDGIGIWDDMFWANKKRAYEILEMLAKKKLGYIIEARADQLLRDDSELLKKISDTGCMQVFVGAESGNQGILDYLNKNARVEDYHKLIELSDKYKVATRFSLIVGFPYECIPGVNQTLDLADKINSGNDYCSVSGPKLFTPYPGTMEFDRAVQRGFKVPTNTAGWSQIHRKTDDYINKFPWLRENLDTKTIERLEGSLR